MAGDQPVELADQAGVSPAGQVGLHPVLHRGHSGLFQPGRIRLREREVGDIRQGRPAPHAQGLAQPGRRHLGPPGGQVLPGGGHQLGEPVGVKLALAERYAVSGRLRDHRRGAVAQRAAQPGDVDPQGRHVVLRSPARPQVLGEPVGGHHLAGRQQQPRKQGPLPQPAQISDQPAVRYLDGPENAKLHDGYQLRWALRSS